MDVRQVASDNQIAGASDSRPPCPIVHGETFDPFRDAQSGDPFPWLELAQREQPVFYLPEHDMWCVTRYEDVLAIARDVRRFSSATVRDTTLHPDVAAMFPHGHPIKHAMVVADPPRHSRLRKAAQPKFTPGAIQDQEALVRGLANALVDRFEAAGRCDFVSQYSRLLPLQVVTVMCGMPLEAAEAFANLDNEKLVQSDGGDSVSPEERVQAARMRTEFTIWVEGIAEQRRVAPADDVISVLVHSRNATGEPALAMHEIVAQVNNILGAGTFTTATALPTMVLQLLRRPDQWGALRADRSLIPLAVEESLRVSNPVRGVVRTTTTAVTVQGVTIPADAQVYIHFGAAQRDVEVFRNPHEFDMFREDLRKHYGFGRGAHMCLGAPLARLEMAVTLDCLLDRLPGLRVAPGYEPQWRAEIVSPDLLGLDLEWDGKSS